MPKVIPNSELNKRLEELTQRFETHLALTHHMNSEPIRSFYSELFHSPIFIVQYRLQDDNSWNCIRPPDGSSPFQRFEKIESAILEVFRLINEPLGTCSMYQIIQNSGPSSTNKVIITNDQLYKRAKYVGIYHDSSGLL